MRLWSLGALLLVAAGWLFRRRLQAYREREQINDDMIRHIEQHGNIVLEDPEPLDLPHIREQEAQFWDESTWDEPEEM